MKPLPHTLLRLYILALMLIMLMVQSYLLHHEVEHVLSGDNDSCMVCQLADHQSHGLLVVALVIAAGQFTLPAIEVPFTLHKRPVRYFASRAPPATRFL